MVMCCPCTKSHLRFTRAFAHTLHAIQPDVPYYVLVADATQDELPAPSESHIYLGLDAVLSDPIERRHLTFMYDGFELACALKPLLIRHLLDRTGADTVVHVDCDMSVHSRLPEPALPAGPASVVLTPHWVTDTAPSMQAKWLLHGAINAGYVAVRNDAAGRSFLDYWWERCRQFCVWEPSEGLYCDQPWLSLAPSVFGANVSLCRHHGVNVSWWNLHERGLRLRGDCVLTASGQPVSLFHWSQVQLDGSDRLFRHELAEDATGCAETPSAVCTLHGRYVALLQKSSLDSDRGRYRYSTFSDGSPIARDDRRTYRHRGQVLRDESRSPFDEVKWFKSHRLRARLRNASRRITGSNRLATVVASVARAGKTRLTASRRR